VHELVLFLGRFHPVLVHLPIGILLVLGLLEAAGLAAYFPGLKWLPALTPRQRTLILVVGAAAAVLTAGLGWLLAHGGDYDLALVRRHQVLGICAAGAAVLLLIVHRWWWLYGPLLAASLVLLAAAAHAGAGITHGSDYLTAHMPRSLARVLGLTPAPVPVPRVVTLDNAVVYGDLVQPLLQERCVSCHGPSKSNGGLRLDAWELIEKGGKHGAVLKPGDAAASALIRRIDLAADEKEHMPPRGKPQLSDDDLTLLEWWVAAGAPRERRVAELELPPSVQVILDARLAHGSADLPPERAATLAAAARLAAALGILIRPLSPDGPWVDVTARMAGARFGDGELAQLAPIAAAVQWLDLGGTSVTDAGLAGLARMRRLERLHLDGLKVTDDGLARLSPLRQLEYLNLRGTLVTDKGMPALRSLPRLRSLYVWQTAVTPAAVQALGDALVDKRRVARWRQGQDDLERRIRRDRFDGNTGEALVPAEMKPLPVSSPDDNKPATPDKTKAP